jgi:hypothetical protein
MIVIQWDRVRYYTALSVRELLTNRVNCIIFRPESVADGRESVNDHAYEKASEILNDKDKHMTDAEDEACRQRKYKSKSSTT